MKTININIRKARIKQYTVELGESRVDVSAQISLLTENDKEISTFSISTRKYYDTNFDLPFGMVDPIKSIAGQLEEILIKEATKALKLIPEKSFGGGNDTSRKSA